MSVAALLSELERLNVDLRLDAGQLRFRAPSGVISGDVRRRLSLHKADLIRIYQDATRLSAQVPAQQFSDEDLPLTPNQIWYLSTFEPERHAWAITVALDAPWPVNEAALRATLSELARRHDVLRLRLYRTPDGNWAQRMLAGAEVPITVHDMAGLKSTALRHALHEAGHRAQLSLNILQGPVISLALCKCGDGEPDKIIVALHHEIVDAYSVKLFIEELRRVYQEVIADGRARVNPTAARYRDYLIGLYAYTHQLSVVARALAFWCDPVRLRRLPELPVDMPNGRHTDVNSRRISIPLEPSLWQKLVKYIRSGKGISFNDLLLFGLAQAFFRWTGQRVVRVDLDYHVRIGLLPGMDLLRTIGPATIKFPVLLNVDPDCGMEHGLRELRRSVQETVDNALGYGFLRYTCTDPEIRQQLSECARPQVFVNNRSTLGLSKAADQSAIVTKSMKFLQPGVRENPVSYDIMVECDGSDDRLVLSWVYSSAIHHEQTIRTLSSCFFSSLHALTAERD